MRNTWREDKEKREIEIESKDANEITAIKSSRADSTGSKFNE